MAKGVFGGFGSLREMLGRVAEDIRDRGDDLGPAAPKALVRTVLSTVDSGSKSWPGGDREFPNFITIRMGAAPFEAYYSHMLANSCGRIEQAVVDHIGRKGSAAGKVLVRIVMEPLLAGNRVRVTAEFDENLADPIKTSKFVMDSQEARDSIRAEMTVEEDGSTSEVVAPSVPTQCVANLVKDAEAAGGDAPAGLEEEVSTPRPSLRVTFNGATETVRDRGTIGAARYADRPAPDVSLPYDLCPGTSHLHGSFELTDDDEWRFTNLGGNGTLIQRGGEQIALRKDESATLADGDTMLLGCHQAELAVTIDAALTE